MSPLKVLVIDSGISARTEPLYRALQSNSNIQAVKIPATMVRTISMCEIAGIDFSDLEFRKKTQRSFLPGEVGCAYSHNIAREMASEETDGVLILEDDARISDSVKLVQLVEQFKLRIVDELAVLSLTSFPTAGQAINDVDSKDFQFLRLKGQPPLAVAYFVRPKAAAALKVANSPIKYVADWPNARVNYYVSNACLVTHGDSETQSTIDAPGAELRHAHTVKKLGSAKFIFYNLTTLLLGGFNYTLIRLRSSLIYRIDLFIFRWKFRKFL